VLLFAPGEWRRARGQGAGEAGWLITEIARVAIDDVSEPECRSH
jgi:hypothetical protein